MSEVRPGWYPDPAEPETQRYWNGEEWLGGRLPVGVTPPDGPAPDSPPTAPGTPGAGILPGLAGTTDLRAPGPPPGPGTPPPLSAAGPGPASAPPSSPSPATPTPGSPTSSPGSGASTPGAPTLGTPTPGTPTPGTPTPGTPTPGAASPGAPMPGTHPGVGSPPGGPFGPGPGAWPPPGQGTKVTYPPFAVPGSLPGSLPGPVAAPAPVPHGHPLAPLGSRFLARLVDVGVVALLNIVNVYLFVYPSLKIIWPVVRAAADPLAPRQTSLSEADQSEFNSLVLASLLFLLALWFAYEVPAHANDGQTLGKRLLGIKVMRLESEEKLGFWRAFRRWMTLSLPTLLWTCFGVGFVLQILGCATCLVDPYRQCLHDRSALTVVVHVGRRRREKSGGDR